VIFVLEFTVMLVTAVVSNLTAVAPVKPVPVTVTHVPPVTCPPDGEMAVTVGRAAYTYRLPDTFALVPPGVVTVTYTGPSAWAGAVTRMLVLEFTTRLVPAAEPKLTAVAPVRLVPVSLTRVAPVRGPLAGRTAVTPGRITYENRLACTVALVPSGVVTVIYTVPPAWGGAVTVMFVSEFTARLVAGVVPNLTAVAPVNLVPVIVTRVPPATGPLAGEIAVTPGLIVYVKRLACGAALVPPGVVTVTYTVPPAWAGAVTVMPVSAFTVRLVAGVVPNLTAVDPVNPVPVSVTRVPPVTGPLAGAMPVTAGAATTL
jgi:hypothetical protein